MFIIRTNVRYNQIWAIEQNTLERMFKYNFIGFLKNIYKNLLTTKQYCVTIKLQTKQQQVFIQKILFKKIQKSC